MNELQEKQLFFLEDTKDYYSANTSRRSVVSYPTTSNICLYFDPITHNKCAIGRYLDSKHYSIEMEELPVFKIFYLLPDKLKELG
jgi:hypothetical protein